MKTLKEIFIFMAFIVYNLVASVCMCIPLGMLFGTGCFDAKHTFLEWFFGVFIMLLAIASQKPIFAYFLKRID